MTIKQNDFFLAFFAPLKAKASDRMGKLTGWCLFYLNCHLPFLKSALCPIPPSWYLLACIQVDDAASHFFAWAAGGLCGWCTGTDLGKLSIPHCFNRSSFNHLASFHLEVFNSIIRNFAVRKIKSGWPWQSRSLILPDLFRKVEKRTASTEWTADSLEGWEGMYWIH